MTDIPRTLIICVSLHPISNQQKIDMQKNLVIVESPAKAKTIEKFLGKDYKVMSSYGHIRDLKTKDFSIDLEHNYAPEYVIPSDKKKLVTELKNEAKKAEQVWLASDEDREGEAISWHLYEVLGLKPENTKRIVFHEITKNAILHAIETPRDINIDLVNAQQARRILDRIVGFELSPILWRKVKPALSAGRVQSVAVRLIVEREREINEFVSEAAYRVIASFILPDGTTILKAELNRRLKDKEEVEAFLESCKDASFTIDDISKKPVRKTPAPPFTTSTLQQEAARKLGYSVSQTMMIAQRLYESGLITYMRTDYENLSDLALGTAKEAILDTYGEKYYKFRQYHTKSKGAQEAHEAIRPTNVSRTPESIKDSLSKDQYRLYKLIWERFVASQMSPAVYDTLSVKLSAGDYTFRASGSRLRFSGFLEAYSKGEEEDEKVIPKLTQGDILQAEQLLPEQHFTQPPARYTDASLIKTLEEIGVGRPSTYAPTLTTIQARHYVTKEAKNLFPTELGEMVDEIMKTYFPDIVDIDFTANMEKRLDDVEMGKEEWKQIIRDFYPDFKKSVENAAEKLEKIEIKDEETDIVCEKCGRNMVIKYGRYGKFLACPGFPECQNAKPYFEEAGVNCRECGGKVLINKTKKGRIYYGCEHNGDGCDFMSWNKPTGEKCPECGAFLEEKGRKNPKIVCSNEKCGYMKEKPAEEENEE